MIPRRALVWREPSAPSRRAAGALGDACRPEADEVLAAKLGARDVDDGPAGGEFAAAGLVLRLPVCQLEAESFQLHRHVDRAHGH